MDGECAIPEYTVVVPVFESHSSVKSLVERTNTVFDQHLKVSHELILIDDGSRNPQTWHMLTELATADPRVTAIRLMRNYGKPAAVMCGLAHAQGDWIVTIDDDLQQRPEDIFELAKFKFHDVVVGTYPKKFHSLPIRVASRLKTMFDRHVLHLPFPMSPLKLMKRSVVDEMLRIRTGRPYIPALLAHVTTDFRSVELQHRPSEVGKSRYTYVRRLRQFSNLLISSSGFLLRTISVIGAFLFAAGTVDAIYLLTSWLWTGSGPSAWAVLTVLNLCIGGLTLLGLGFVGEYLIRIIELASARPAYSIRETTIASQRTNERTAQTDELPRVSNE